MDTGAVPARQVADAGQGRRHARVPLHPRGEGPADGGGARVYYETDHYAGWPAVLARAAAMSDAELVHWVTRLAGAGAEKLMAEHDGPASETNQLAKAELSTRAAAPSWRPCAPHSGHRARPSARRAAPRCFSSSSALSCAMMAASSAATLGRLLGGDAGLLGLALGLQARSRRGGPLPRPSAWRATLRARAALRRPPSTSPAVPRIPHRPGSGLALEPLEQGLLGFLRTGESVFHAGALRAAPHSSCSLADFRPRPRDAPAVNVMVRRCV